MRPRTVAVALVSLLLAVSIAGAGVGHAQDQFVSGEPELSVYAPETALTPGETTQFELQIGNDGELDWGTGTRRGEVTTARNVEVELRDGDAPFEVETGRQSIGSIPDGAVRSAQISVTVPADADPGTYTLDVRLRYSHTALSDPRTGVVQERSRRVTRSVDVTVEERPRFELRTVRSDAQVGTTGSIAVEIENDGTEPARDVVLALESGSASAALGGASSDAGPVGRLAPGETAVVEYDVDVREGTSVRNYSLDGTVRYTDPDGIRGAQEGLAVRFRPLEPQEFDVTVEESSLRVGETGEIVGTVHNDGPVAVEDVGVDLAAGRLETRGGGYVVGDLEAGESATFRLRAAVPGTADPSVRRAHVVTSYRTADGRDRSESDPISVRVVEQTFDVTVEESSLRVGETGAIVGTVHNRGPADVEAVAVTLGESQFEPRSRTYAIGDLEAGESGSFRLQAAVPEGVDAVPQRIDVTTTYRTATGADRSATEPIRVPVAERRDAVSVAAVDPAFEVDESGTLAVEVTNRLDVEIRDVRLRLAVEPPLESEFATAVVPSLAPGETGQVRFDLEIDGDAPRSQYPAVVEVAYVDDDDETATARPSTLAVRVTEGDDAVPTEELFVGAGVLLVLVAAGWWFYGRRLN